MGCKVSKRKAPAAAGDGVSPGNPAPVSDAVEAFVPVADDDDQDAPVQGKDKAAKAAASGDPTAPAAAGEPEPPAAAGQASGEPDEGGEGAHGAEAGENGVGPHTEDEAEDVDGVGEESEVLESGKADDLKLQSAASGEPLFDGIVPGGDIESAGKPSDPPPPAKDADALVVEDDVDLFEVTDL